jgi:radical SAM protein with 4Fe4S-binding SPASM domain
MANLLITAKCNRKCPFCFASNRMQQMRRGDDRISMSYETIRQIMDDLETSGLKELRLLGGEPTLHPSFVDIVQEAIERQFHVQLFTNGMMAATTADFVAELPKQQLSVLCNISPQAQDSRHLIQLRDYALKRLGRKVHLGITITSPEFEWDYLISTIEQYNLMKRIRLGVAQPIVGKQNDYLHPDQYRQTGRRIVEMAKTCIKEDILVGFDCGMTLCMFSEAELGILTTSSEGFRAVCRPIIDIGPQLDVWHCFPLSEVYNTEYAHFENRHDIVRTYQRLMQPYRSLGCMPACRTCDYLRRNQCTGGCLAHTLKEMRPAPPNRVEWHPKTHTRT